MKKTLITVSMLLTGATVLAEPVGPAIVDSHRISFTAPARRVPAQNMVDGPLLGNGDIGVVVAGTPDQLRFHIGKNDFWGIRTQAPMAVGQIQLLIPAIAGAPYKAECDMRRAHWQGTFAQGAAALTTRAWVDANANDLVIELNNIGTTPLSITINQTKGAGAGQTLPAQVDANPHPLLAGCEQHGRRWYFQGEIADLKIADKPLAAAEIANLAKIAHGAALAYDGKTTTTLTPPAIAKQLAISAWIKIADFDAKEANYLVSKGEWNQAYSLGLSAGKLRFAINGTMLQTDAALPKDEWIHVAAIYDGKQMALYLNGKMVKQLGGGAGMDGLAFLYDPDAGQPNARKIGVATRIVGEKAEAASITLAPGGKTAIATAILSDIDAPKELGDFLAGQPLKAAELLIANLTLEKIAVAAAAHQAWWEKFWNQSFVEIPDKVIEQHWYSTQYIMASCSRPGKVAPGLWGNWITRDDTFWHGDFHLNYNFQAPFYSVYSANHAEVSLPLYDAMVQSIPRGQRIAVKRGWKGIHLPVSIGPWGMCPEGDDSDWGQRSNTAYAALNFIWYYQYTQDQEWLKTTGYPYLREVEKFWTDYLKLENGRYVIYNDSIHEGSGPDFNPILSLGLVRTLYKNLLIMSEDLGVDAELRPKWQDILAKISDWPLQERNGKTVFRYSEKGMPWCDSNTLGIQHIFPSCAIGFDSDPKLLEISRNMLDAMGRWRDNNGSSSWYTACAHVGYQPEKILAEMRRMYETHSMPNKLLYFGGGGIENASPSLAINEMLLQSYEGVIRFFPCWPKELDARFGTLRARGAFLVSAELKGGVIGGVKILSEKGKDVTVQNPWPGQKVQVVRHGQPVETATGDRFTLKTSPGEIIELQPK